MANSLSQEFGVRARCASECACACICECANFITITDCLWEHLCLGIIRQRTNTNQDDSSFPLSSTNILLPFQSIPPHLKINMLVLPSVFDLLRSDSFQFFMLFFSVKHISCCFVSVDFLWDSRINLVSRRIACCDPVVKHHPFNRKSLHFINHQHTQPLQFALLTNAKLIQFSVTLNPSFCHCYCMHVFLFFSITPWSVSFSLSMT